jgi:uncharacterized membrane protein (DUF373 family)
MIHNIIRKVIFHIQHKNYNVGFLFALGLIVMAMF